jgi:hypothetical protein
MTVTTQAERVALKVGSALTGHILHVVLLGPNEMVRMPHTVADVAPVADLLAERDVALR